MTTIIKKGRPNDAHDLSKLAARLFKQTYQDKMPLKDLDSYIAEDFRREQKFAELQDINIITLLAEDAGKLVGYAQVRRKPIPVEVIPTVTIELWRIYLDKSYQGFGVGKLLLSRVGEEARSLSGDLVWLGVWEQNHQAISFYEKHGFRVVGSHEFNVGTESQNDLVMIGSTHAF